MSCVSAREGLALEQLNVTLSATKHAFPCQIFSSNTKSPILMT